MVKSLPPWRAEVEAWLTCEVVREKGSEAAARRADADGSDQLRQGPIEEAEEVVCLSQEFPEGSIPHTLPVPRCTCACTGTVPIGAATAGACTGAAHPWAAKGVPQLVHASCAHQQPGIACSAHPVRHRQPSSQEEWQEIRTNTW